MKRKQTGRRWLTKKQVASRIQSSVSYVEKHLGEISHFKIGRRLLFDKDEIDAWIESHRVTKNQDDMKELIEEVVRKISKGGDR